MRTSSLLILGFLGACRPSAASTPPVEPDPPADRAEPESDDASDRAPAALVMPTLRGPYVQRRDYDYADGPAVFKRVAFTFEGSTVAARYLMVFVPNGGAKESTTRICTATVRVPVEWVEGGFTVASDATAESEAIVYNRTEAPAEAEDHDYVAEWTHGATSCSVMLRAGFYRLESVSKGKLMDRPHSVVLVRDDDRIELELSDEGEEEKDLQRTIDGHFGRTPNFD